MYSIKDAAQRAASELVDAIVAFSASREYIVLALCGGSSPTSLYEALRERLNLLDKGISKKLRFIPLDERCVPTQDPQHNLAGITVQFLEPLLSTETISPEQICWYFQEDEIDPALASFNKKFSALGGRIDIVIAGSGEDGHIASLFAGLPAIGDCSSETFTLVDNSPKAPPQRMTATRKLITNAIVTVAIFQKGKEDAYSHFRNPLSTPEKDCPAKILRTFTGTLCEQLQPTLYTVSNIT